MSRGVSKTRPPTQSVENLLQFRAAGNDHAGVDRAQIEQQAKVVQVPIEERIFVVPFDFQCHTVLVAIDLVGRCNKFRFVHDDARIEGLLYPAQFREMRIELAGDQSFRAAGSHDVAFEQAKSFENGENIAPLVRMSGRQNRESIAPFVHLVTLGNIGGDNGSIRHRASFPRTLQAT